MIGQKNQYTCDTCGLTVTTIDRDEGVTPMMMACRECPGGKMSSHWYTVAQDLEPDYEWFKPAKLAGYSAAMKDHIRRGGLDIRAVDTAERTVG